MGEYFIGSDGELYHWQLKNHKYIKREKKNGKWVYTYPEENKSGETPVTKKKTDLVTSGKTSANSAVTGARNSVKPMSQQFARKIQQARDVITNDFGNYKPIGGQSLAGDSKSPNISKTTTKTTKATNEADEYGFGKYNPITGESLVKSMTYKSGSDKDKTETKKVSSEYEAELAYNSKKNDYGDAVKKTPETKKQEEKKKEPSWLDNLGDWASDKLKGIGDNIEDIVDDAGDFIDDAKDWIGDKADDLYDATIGEVKDALGYDERTAMYKAQEKFEKSEEKLFKGVNDLRVDVLMAHDYGGIGQIWDDSSTFALEHYYEDYALADAELRWAKAAYDNTLLGKIDNWINNKKPQAESPWDRELKQEHVIREEILYEKVIPEKVIEEKVIPEKTIKEQTILEKEENESGIVGKRLELDPYLLSKETDYFVALMKLMSVEEYVHKYNPDKTSPVHYYLGRLATDVDEAREELERTVAYDTDLWDYRTDRNLEMERVNRIYDEIEDMIGYNWRHTR